VDAINVVVGKFSNLNIVIIQQVFFENGFVGIDFGTDNLP